MCSAFRVRPCISTSPYDSHYGWGPKLSRKVPFKPKHFAAATVVKPGLLGVVLYAISSATRTASGAKTQLDGGMQLRYRESAGPPRTTSWPVTTRTGFSGFRAPNTNPRREVVTVPLSDSKSRASREMMFSAPSCSGQLLVENASLTGLSPRKRRAPTPPCL